ncbi:MAG: lyase [Pseudomonadota bacterium]
MRNGTTRSASSITALLLFLASTLSTADTLDVELTEWRVPISMSPDGTLHDAYPGDGRSMTRPRDPALDSEGNVWFCGQGGNYIGRLHPASGEFTRFALPERTHPHNLIIDRHDQVWYAGNRNGHIGRLDPATGDIQQFPLDDPKIDPHTLTFNRDGNIWFTAQHANLVGLLDTRAGTYQLLRTPHPSARPYGIMMDSQDHPWIALFGTNRIATVDPTTMKMRTYAIPDDTARPRRLAVTSDDKVWYVDYRRGYLGRLDPKSGDFTEWAAPGAEAAIPYAMTVDDEDRLWFVESPERESHLVGFDARSERFIAREAIPSGGLTARYMVHHKRSDSLWFGTDANTLVRAGLGGD